MANTEVVFGRGQERRAHPHPGRAQRESGGNLSPGADTAGSQHRRRPHCIDNLRNQNHGRDLTGVPTGFVTLRDNDVDAIIGVPTGVGSGTGQRSDGHPGGMCLFEHVGRR